MRAWPGWVAAVLLIALALTSAPDALDTGSPTRVAQSAAASEVGEKRDVRPHHDGLETRHQIAERGAPGHLRLSALPPSSQTAAPIPVRGVVRAAPEATSATVVVAHGPPGTHARTPEALQIFRC